MIRKTFEITAVACGIFASALTIQPASAASLSALSSFNGANGANPYAGLIADAHGNLFGTTYGGGENGLGTVFEIVKTASGYNSTPTTIVSFNGANGAIPGLGGPGVIADANGNLFGTTQAGGAYGQGTVFEIVKTASGYNSTPTTIVSFNGANGRYPRAGLIADADGNLFGGTIYGGDNDQGTVFEIVKTASGYNSTPTTLVSFDTRYGGGPGGAAGPSGSLIADAYGNLFGTTWGGGDKNLGTVFEIVKTASGYNSTPTIIVSFNGANGWNPNAPLIADAHGNLFGTTAEVETHDGQGSRGQGTVFEIVKTASGYDSTPTTIVSFDVGSGSSPYAGLIADANGNLFGTTSQGGANNQGTVFKVVNSGFVRFSFAGTPGNANCSGESVSTLARQYGGLGSAASALRYSSVAVLQEAIRLFCRI